MDFFFTVNLKGLLLLKKKYQSGDRKHVVDCVRQVIQQSFDNLII